MECPRPLLGRKVGMGQPSASGYLPGTCTMHCHFPTSQVHALQPCGHPVSSPAWVYILRAWSALIGVTGGEEFSEHAATCPVNCLRGLAQPAVSRASSARALLIIPVGIISTHHLCAQGCGVPLKNPTPISQRPFLLRV